MQADINGRADRRGFRSLDEHALHADIDSLPLDQLALRPQLNLRLERYATSAAPLVLNLSLSSANQAKDSVFVHGLIEEEARASTEALLHCVGILIVANQDHGGHTIKPLTAHLPRQFGTVW